MEIHFGCAQTRASRRMWCLAARGSGLGSRTSRTANTMSRGNGVKGHTRSGADDESRTRGLDPMTHGVVALCLLSYIRKICEPNHRPVPRSTRSKLLKSVHRCRWCDPSIAGLRRCAGRLKSEKKKARILSESGPLQTELGGCARIYVSALPSPGCTESSFRSSCQWHVGKAWCMAAPHAPSDFIAEARTNATRPIMGRVVLTTCLDFTMKLPEKSCAR
jgi:hypothetical protein